MTAQFTYGSYPSRPGTTHHEPHAALLIDFDNVTMGIRSDLTKELKNLLNSAIIKGKVAVQRAYADWRRYPQYIVPLAEASVDLIFAPAYGSSKKNATDIRLAIDALELVFTRSEIGTFILLSGDSDFSSLVLKLKEYGKYVIGVGIRESASDLLVQNCDEYYSYSGLTGLTRAGELTGAAGHDPWELVEIAVRQMVADGDVMRSDRLKQVILELDPNFNEKTLGFPKFNRFVQEAANRDLVRLHKMENGQFEVALPDTEPAAEEAVRPPEEERGDGRRRGRRSRGRRDAEPQLSRNGGTVQDERAVPPGAEVVEHVAEPEPVAAVVPGSDLDSAYQLLRRAAADVAAEGNGVARDSDVKRRMLEIQKDWDESAYGFSKFSRFLRQAHDAEVINLRRLENGNYEIAVTTTGDAQAQPQPVRPAPATVGTEPIGRRDRRPRRGERGRPQPLTEDSITALVAQVGREPERRAVESSSRPEPSPERARAEPRIEPQREATREPEPERASAPDVAPALGVGPRRGSRGRTLGAPPPLLQGQTVAARRTTAAEPAAATATSETVSGARLETEEPPARPRPSRRQRDKEPAPPAQFFAASPPRQTISEGAEPPARPNRVRDGRPTPLDPAALGLPVDATGVIEYLVHNYKGVGRRSGELLVEALGAPNVFRALESDPDRVKEVLGPARGAKLVDAWRADHAVRRAGRSSARTAPNPAAELMSSERPRPADEAIDDEQSGPRRRGRRSRGRRGGRKRATGPGPA
ncbi:MAG: NYN domain-containing protein [Longimicrobiales bacterium]